MSDSARFRLLGSRRAGGAEVRATGPQTRRQLLGRTARVLGGLAVAKHLSGCLEEGPVALVYLRDRTISAGEGRADFDQEFARQVLDGGCLEGGWIAFVDLSSQPRFIEGGPARNGKAVRRAYAKLLASSGPTHEGTDTCRGLALAEEWLARPEFRQARRIVLGWTDLIADAASRSDGSKQVFRDPLEFPWQKLQPEVQIWGVPIAQARAVRTAWNLRVLRTYLPGDRFDAKLLGLTPRSL